MSGWVKLHRSLQKWGWKKSPNHTAVFIDLLLEANHEDGEYMGVKIPRGSLTTSVKAISLRSGVTQKSVRTVLNHLKQTSELAIKTTTKFTMISINKWDEYQLTGEHLGKQVANDGQTTGKRRATNKNSRIKEVKNNTLELAEDRMATTHEKLAETGAILSPEWLVIEHYNRVNERGLKQTDSNYKEIRARLREGYTVDEMKTLIEHAAKVWSADAFWKPFNRPSTLFNGKFGQYLDQAQNAGKMSTEEEDAIIARYFPGA